MKTEEIVGICPDCGWIDDENRYSRCQKCLADGVRVAMDTISQLELERMKKRGQQEFSLQLYEVSFWNGDEVYPEGYSVLVVAENEEQAVLKGEKKKKDPKDRLEKTHCVQEVDGYLISLRKKV